jgi:hypothetical protein
MTNSARVSGVCVLLVLCFVLWYTVASDYGDAVTSGTYHLAQNGETSTLVLKPDHSFQQELNKLGNVERAAGTWRRFGEGAIEFSKDFLIVSGQEPGADGTPYGEIHKRFGFLVTLTLSQYHVLWYGRVGPSPNNTVSGTYAGDEKGVPATLVLKEDHTFVQTVSHLGVERRAEGTWNFSKSGDIVFSRAFLKTSGETLREGESALAWDPKGSNLQVQIAMTSKSGAPTFRKRQLPW